MRLDSSVLPAIHQVGVHRPNSAEDDVLRLFCVGIRSVALQEISGIHWPSFHSYRDCTQNSVELRKIRGDAPCLEDFRTVHQRIVQLWKDRVSGKANVAHRLPRLHAIARFHNYTARLHMYKVDECIVTERLMQVTERLVPTNLCAGLATPAVNGH